MNILGIGEIVLDKINLLSDFPSEGIKVNPRKVVISLGGPVTSALILLSRLGVRCTFIGSLGNDLNGRKIKDKLAQENITFFPRIQSRTKVNLVLINEKNGSRTVIKDNIKSTPIKSIPEKIIKSADLIIFDRHEPLAFEEILKKKNKQTKIILDPSTDVSRRILQMIKQVDFPILPIESLNKLFGHKKIEEKIQLFSNILQKTFIITAGEYGSVIHDGIRPKLIPAFDVKVIDTLGAGDIFRGAFAFGILNGWDIERTVIFANLVAGLQCTRLGNGSAIPTKEEIFKSEKTSIQKEISLNQIL